MLKANVRTRNAAEVKSQVPDLEWSMNTKTGVSLNIPAKVTCPEATNACKSVCYASRGRYLMNGAAVTGRNLERLQKDVTVVERAKIPNGVQAVRLLGAGDIFSVDFCRSLFTMCDKNPDRRFWAYTRSFSILRSVLKERQLPANLVLFVSADKDNYKKAQKMSKDFGLPIAAMGDAVKKQVSFTCPAIAVPDKFPLTRKKQETPCQRCKYCFNEKTDDKRKSRGVRFPLH